MSSRVARRVSRRLKGMAPIPAVSAAARPARGRRAAERPASTTTQQRPTRAAGGAAVGRKAKASAPARATKRSRSTGASRAAKKRPGAAATASADAPDTPFKHGTLSRDFDTARGAARGFDAVAGVDEAGRGPLAGPVVAAACVVASDVRIEGIHDSKLLTEPERELLYDALVAHPGVSWAVSVIDHDVIDEINILQATMRAMERAVASLPSPPQLVLVDGPRVPAGLASDEALTAEPVVKGDSKSYSIAAASVIAKVTRDRIMMKVHAEYPQYGFAQHKGYPTRDHVAAVHRHGPCPIHRRTFAPIKHMKLK